MTPEELIDQLRVDSRSVRICDVTDMILRSLILLDAQSDSFQEIKKRVGKSYIGMLNSITATLFTNLSMIGKTEEEKANIAREIANSGEVKKVGVAVMKEKEQA